MDRVEKSKAAGFAGGNDYYVPLEKQVEGLLRREIETRGGLCYKFVSPGCAGVPDRVVIWRGGVWFVELKTDSGKVSPIQAHVHGVMRRAGAQVEVLRGIGDVRRFLARIDPPAEEPAEEDQTHEV